jgi:glycosyltransferase involved in cell wall biosynthesis
VKAHLFSVITVTLNCAANAVRTAQSVFRQNFTEYEYIVKDGGSTDGTIEHLRALGAQVTVRPDAGIFDAMNQALDLCSGEFVYFLNAGDVFVGEQVLLQVAEQVAARPAVDFFYGNVILHQDDRYVQLKNQAGLGPLVLPPERLSPFYLFRWGLCHQAWFVRRSLYQARPFDTRYALLGDYDFLLNQVLGRQVVYKHIPVLVAEYSAGGRSEREQARRLAERQLVLRAYFSPSNACSTRWCAWSGMEHCMSRSDCTPGSRR